MQDRKFPLWQSKHQVAQRICDYLRLRGWRVHRLEADISGPKARVKRGRAGTPGYIAVRKRDWETDGYDVWYIEVKRPNGKLRRSQEIWISEARDAGWNVAVASSVGDLISNGMPSE